MKFIKHRLAPGTSTESETMRNPTHLDPSQYCEMYENRYSDAGQHCGHEECDTSCEFIYTEADFANEVAA
ncbi:hypothetical protein ACFXON_23340 [Bacillus subtilis]